MVSSGRRCCRWCLLVGGAADGVFWWEVLPMVSSGPRCCRWCPLVRGAADGVLWSEVLPMVYFSVEAVDQQRSACDL